MRRIALCLGVAAVTLAATIGAIDGASRQAAPSRAQAGRAERLLERRVACLGCHRVAGRGGQIGPTLDGLALRADAERVSAVIRDPAAAIPGTIMPRQLVPERDLDGLVAYLLALPAEPTSSGPSVTPQAPTALAEGEREDGGALYARHCAACHGERGGGDGWNAVNLPVRPTAHADGALMGARTDDALFDAIHAGAYVLDGSARMPAFGRMLSTIQIRALVAHIRELCDCVQPAWAASR